MAASNTSEMIVALEQCLQEQLAFYQAYAKHLAKDNEFMARLKVDDLEKSNKIKNTILLKLQAMDQGRQTLVKQIAKGYGVAEDKVTIADVCKFLKADESTRLLDLRDQLQAIMKELKVLQENTSALANASLAWINGSMTALRNLLTPTGTYNLRGRVDHPGMFSGRTVEKAV